MQRMQLCTHQSRLREISHIMVVRIIPRLDIKGPNLVKGIHLEGLRVLGKPEAFAKFYYENGADELFYMDIVASLYQRNNLLDIIKTTSREIFIPLTVGGGIRSIDDINAVLRAGADKVAINTAAIKDPHFIQKASRHFGSSTIVVSIEAKRKPDCSYEAYIDCGREKTGVEVLTWAKKAYELGAGEIMITSIDQEGTGRGYDIEITKRIAEEVPIPVIACGGAGNQQHILDVIQHGKADAVSIASVFHYYVLENTGSNCTNGYNNEKTLNPHPGFRSTTVAPLSIGDVKQFLLEKGIDCRK